MNDKRAMSAENATDVDLLSRIVRKDRLALRSFFARYHMRLFRYLVRLTQNDALAEEIVNEVFLNVWRKADSFKGQSAVSSWVFSIAHNRAISELRKRKEMPLDEATALAIEDDADTPETVSLKADKATAIRRCLDGLSTDHREVIDLVYYQDKSVKEVAEIVGIPENTVKTRMFHARQKLSILMGEAGIDRGWP